MITIWSIVLRLLMPAAAVAFAACAHARDLPLGDIRLPPGFSIELYAGDVPGARSLRLGPEGVVFVSTRKAGNIYALVDGNGDYIVDEVKTIASNLDTPNGIAYREGTLFVVENPRILRFDGIDASLETLHQPTVLINDLPTERHHGWRYAGLGPDGWLYFSIGAPCNVCAQEGFAVIERIRTDGSGRQTYAEGVRNSIGFDWHPDTGELWFTDNGRDWLGDEVPPDELNHAPRPGLHFGFPFCHGSNVRDPEFGALGRCADATPPELEMMAHVAALGMRFYTGDQFPDDYHGDIIIAQHGSWNRSTKVGYRLLRVKMNGSKVVGSEAFAEGWLHGQRPWGRPVDVLVMPDGSLLVSDDAAGAVYRISYTNR